MTKISIDKNDHITEIIEKVLDAKDSEITLVIPKQSALKSSGTNFRLLGREAASASKRVIVESVDEEILSLAAKHNLEAVHPLFSSGRPPAFSDIVPGGTAEKKEETQIKETKNLKQRKAEKKPDANALPKFEEEEEIEDEVKSAPTATQEPMLPRGGSPEFLRRLFSRPGARTFGILAVSVTAVLAIVAWGTVRVFGKGEVVLRLNRAPWAYQGNFLADKTVKTANPENKTLPGEVFTTTRNSVQLFPASGKQNVSKKAVGTLTIYNEFSSAPQALVASTRFETPDGKLFRLDRAVTVPGAKVQAGTIAASEIEVSVTADKAGAEHNLGPVARLTIPGFAGSPKFGKFYGELKAATTGGFVGEKPVPTKGDIAAAKKKAEEVLTGALENNLLSGLPEPFTFPAGSREITFTKMNVNEDTDAQGKFSVFAEAELRVIGFRDSDLRSMLSALAGPDAEGKEFRDLEFVYKEVTPDFNKGELRFGVSAEGTLVTALDTEKLARDFAGKGVHEIRRLLLGIPGLEGAHVSLWPSWARRAPGNADRITIVVE
ncbi:MAG: hypothetical protein HY435_02480 [Candidatus Liptonbacteria bacterium]|nr:hypothetical protein [Candidatus Liptonbacteria bacterium]